MSEGDEEKDRLTGAALLPAAKAFGQEVKPLGKEVGELTVRAVRLGLKGVSGLVWGFEQVSVFLERRLSEKLKDVPPEKIGSANPRLAVPAVGALLYSGQEEIIREMFASLLAADLNADSKSQTHPAFVEIIKEMAPNDAQLLQSIVDDGGRAILYSLRVRADKKVSQFKSFDTCLTSGIRGVSMAEALRALSSLDRLGLIELRDGHYPLGPPMDVIADYKGRDEYKQMMDDVAKQFPEGKATDHFTGIFLTHLGRDFAAVCLQPAPPSAGAGGGKEPSSKDQESP